MWNSIIKSRESRAARYLHILKKVVGLRETQQIWQIWDWQVFTSLYGKGIPSPPLWALPLIQNDGCGTVGVLKSFTPCNGRYTGIHWGLSWLQLLLQHFYCVCLDCWECRFSLRNTDVSLQGWGNIWQCRCCIPVLINPASLVNNWMTEIAALETCGPSTSGWHPPPAWTMDCSK